ncbi:hypothetical protein [Thermoflexus sp.]|uniref:hypothetical protein n=1 Tax=Thermoflexus sp. TaxID=1969742 RepID=UPI002ADDE389|nr:hypothetical protein [Thermoflexus sp.]
MDLLNLSGKHPGMGEELQKPPPALWCPRCRAMLPTDQRECPICGARLAEETSRSADFLSLALAFWMYPLLALGIACVGLLLCVALFRWLSR